MVAGKLAVQAPPLPERENQAYLVNKQPEQPLPK